MTYEVNILPFVLEALTQKQSMRQDVDKLYQVNKYQYFKIAKESEYYNHPILLEGNIYRQEYGRKILGILLCSEHDEILSQKIMSLIKKHYRTIYKYAYKNKTISMETLINDVFKKHNKSLDAWSDDEINSIFTILIFLSTQFNKKIEPKTERYIFDILLKRVEYYNKNSQINIKYSYTNNDLMTKTQSLKNRIYTNITEIKNYIDMVGVTEENISKWINGIAYIFDYESLSAPSLFDNIEFKEQNIEEILSAYYIQHKNQNIENASKFLVSGIYIKYLLKTYKELKNYYFANNKETMFVELEGLQNQNNLLKQQVVEMENAIQRQSKQINDLKLQIKNEYQKAEVKFINEIKELVKQNTELEQRIDELEQQETELIALREMMFALEQKNDITLQKTNIKDIDHSNILIVGGHPNWQKQLKEQLPNIRIVDTDALNFNPDLLSNIEIIIFNTAYMNHAMYYKMIAYIRKHGIHVGYITNQNMELSLSQIKQWYDKI